jgi:tetratricopeptide (TPR) repeat protein
MQRDNSSFWTDIKTFEEKLAKFPDSYCFARLSEVYLKVGLIDDALHTARQGVAKYPGYLAGQRALAMACHARGLTDECMTALKLLTVALPEDQQAQKLLGRLLADTGDQDSARKAFQAVLEFDPDDVECLVELESLEVSGGSIHPSPYMDEDAEEEIIEDIEILEEVEAEVEVEVEKEKEVEVEVEEEIEAKAEGKPEPEPEQYNDPLSTATLAELYVKQGFTQKALEIYRSILADDPGNSSVSNRIAELDQPDNLHAAVKRQGTADNALLTFEGWLENIRRVKSCR